MVKRGEVEGRMAAVIAEWRKSGQTRAAFARAHGLTVSKLDYWKRRIGNTPRRRRRPGRAVQLIPVHLRPDVAGETTEVEIVLASGDRLRVGSAVSTERLRQVLAVVREGC
jgi:hypothetical protein